jgi:hypothetical protein
MMYRAAVPNAITIMETIRMRLDTAPDYTVRASDLGWMERTDRISSLTPNAARRLVKFAAFW